tara:strand:+ start:187 stop:444 length:258 start_codon:yes stop_codon:yes gene_type:complete
VGVKIRSETKAEFLEDLRTQVLRFLKAEKARLQIERAFLKSVSSNIKEADRKYKQITEVGVYVDVAKVLGIEAPQSTSTSGELSE